MIPQRVFNGGSRTFQFGSDFTMLPGYDRVLRMDPTTNGLTVKLPSAKFLKKGGPQFVLLNINGSNAFNLTDGDGGSIGTVGVGKAAIMYLVNNETVAGKWLKEERTFNAAASFASGTRSSTISTLQSAETTYTAPTCNIARVKLVDCKGVEPPIYTNTGGFTVGKFASIKDSNGAISCREVQAYNNLAATETVTLIKKFDSCSDCLAAPCSGTCAYRLVDCQGNLPDIITDDDHATMSLEVGSGASIGSFGAVILDSHDTAWLVNAEIDNDDPRTDVTVIEGASECSSFVFTSGCSGNCPPGIDGYDMEIKINADGTTDRHGTDYNSPGYDMRDKLCCGGGCIWSDPFDNTAAGNEGVNWNTTYATCQWYAGANYEVSHGRHAFRYRKTFGLGPIGSYSSIDAKTVPSSVSVTRY